MENTPINVGNTSDFSIKEAAEKIANHIGFVGEIKWNTNKPRGQLKKPSSNKKLQSLGWELKDYTSFDEGIKNTCEWFRINYPFVRGVAPVDVDPYLQTR